MKILLAESDTAESTPIADFLASTGWDVAAVQNEDDAVRAFLHSNIEILITGMRQPKIDGISLINRVRRYRPDTPAILVSEYHGIGSGILDQTGGRTAMIMKPLNLQKLHSTILDLVPGKPRMPQEPC